MARWGRKLDRRVIITKTDVNNREYLVTAFLEDNRMLEVSCEDPYQTSLLGNVYIGKIKRIVPKIGAAFVEIAPGQKVYLPLENVKEPMMAKQSRPGKLTEEDEIVIQIAKEAVKAKPPTASTNISLKGNVLVLTTENKTFGISKKLDADRREHFRLLLADKLDGQFGLIVRTNAQNCPDQEIRAEFERLLQQFHTVTGQYRHRTCYSCLYREPPGYVAKVRDCLAMHLDKIVTDEEAIYEELRQTFQNGTADMDGKLVLYRDPALPLSALCSLKHRLEEALKPRVWLKSGAYLVIQPTEALTVIDVNSGKCVKGNQKDFYLKVNLEAAEEIARQLRLRNISGICIVDFINLDTNGAKEALVHALKGYLAEDAIPTSFIDFTKLGLVEITRKKVKKPLWEQIV